MHARLRCGAGHETAPRQQRTRTTTFPQNNKIIKPVALCSRENRRRRRQTRTHAERAEKRIALHCRQLQLKNIHSGWDGYQPGLWREGRVGGRVEVGRDEIAGEHAHHRCEKSVTKSTTVRPATKKSLGATTPGGRFLTLHPQTRASRWRCSHADGLSNATECRPPHRSPPPERRTTQPASRQRKERVPPAFPPSAAAPTLSLALKFLSAHQFSHPL